MSSILKSGFVLLAALVTLGVLACTPPPTGEKKLLDGGKDGSSALCTKNDDCQEPTPLCSWGKCIAECARHAHCTAPSRPHCDTQKGRCIPPLPECNTDKECTNPYKPRCSKGTCVAECSRNEDCQDPAHPHCQNGTCEPPECAAHKDCSLETKPVCQKGGCAPCSSDEDCKAKDPKTPKCDKGKCVVEGSGCTSDEDCKKKFPDRPVCAQGACVQCQTDSDCKASSGATSAKCDKTKKVCYECTQHSDCRQNYVCDKLARKCIQGCLTDNDCLRGSYCGARNTCVECSKDAHCQRPTPKCSADRGSCVQCLQDSDCPSGQKCDPTLLLCLASKGRSQCQPCSQPGKQAECATGHSCVSTLIGPSTTTWNVKEVVCLKKCKKDADCARGYACCSATNAKARCYTGTQNKERTGTCWPAYPRSYVLPYVYYSSCLALFDQGRRCTTTASGFLQKSNCGEQRRKLPYADSFCAVKENNVCRVPCQKDIDCLSGYTCGCPKGYTAKTSTTRPYCQGSGGTKDRLHMRCMK